MASLPEAARHRFEQLAEQATKIPMRGESNTVPRVQEFYAWAASALTAIRSVFGENSPHYRRFALEMDAIERNFVDGKRLDACRGIFVGAKSDIDAGFLFDMEVSVAGEVFGSFVTAAKRALEEGNHLVAALLASAALEDALKRYGTLQGIEVQGKTMEDVVNALKSKGLLGGAQKSLLGAMPRIRNSAMHAEWDKLTPQDAGSVVGFVEQFLLTHLA